jgi:hypothetical protein
MTGLVPSSDADGTKAASPPPSSPALTEGAEVAGKTSDLHNRTEPMDALSKQDEENGDLKADAGEQVVTPWEVSGGADGKIDYNKLVAQFGCQKIDDALVTRIERVTGMPAHPFLKRGIFFAHR